MPNIVSLGLSLTTHRFMPINFYYISYYDNTYLETYYNHIATILYIYISTAHTTIDIYHRASEYRHPQMSLDDIEHGLLRARPNYFEVPWNYFEKTGSDAVNSWDIEIYLCGIIEGILYVCMNIYNIHD